MCMEMFCRYVKTGGLHTVTHLAYCPDLSSHGLFLLNARIAKCRKGRRFEAHTVV